MVQGKQRQTVFAFVPALGNSILLAILLSQLSLRTQRRRRFDFRGNELFAFVYTERDRLGIDTKQVAPKAPDRVRSQRVPSLSATYLCGAMLFWSSTQECFRMRRNSVAGVVNKRQRRTV